MPLNQDTGKQVTLEQLVIRLGKKVAQMHEVMLMLLETFKADIMFGLLAVARRDKVNSN